MSPDVLTFHDVSVSFHRPGGAVIRALESVSVSLRQGEILGIVGESGSGKSTLAKTAVGLVTPSAGTVSLEGRPVSFTGKGGKQVRRRMQYVLQDSLGSLDPRQRVLSQVVEPLIIHDIGRPADRIDIARALLVRMGVGEHLVRRYPRALSGGQRQRVALARALILQPDILICDESVSALDVSVQAQILNLLMELRREQSLSILFISHDLSVIHHISDRVAVMRQGRIVETNNTARLYEAPQQDYTKRLIAALPVFALDQSGKTPATTIRETSCAG